MKAAFVTMSLCLLGSPAAIADQVVLKGGEAVSGKVLGDHLEIDTTGGHLSVPYSSVQQLIATDSDGVRLKLIDGTVLEGRLIIDSFNVHQGLYDRALLVRDVQSIRWDPPKMTVPAGTAVPLELIRTLSSTSAKAGASVEYCVTEPVVIGGKTVVGKHAPAWGEVLAAGGGTNVSRGGKVGLGVIGVTGIDGTEIPLQGMLQVAGGVDVGSIVAGGVFGLLGEGNAAEATSGSRFNAQTTQDFQIGLIARPVGVERASLQRACDDYYSLLTGDFISTERLGRGQVFAPVPQPLRLSVPIGGLIRSQTRFQQTIYLGTLRMEDLSIQSATLQIEPARNGGAHLEITANILVRPSHDRLVNVEYQLSAGDRVVGTATKPGIRAAEGRLKAAKTSIQLTANQLSALSASDNPRLRIVMTAIED